MRALLDRLGHAFVAPPPTETRASRVDRRRSAESDAAHRAGPADAALSVALLCRPEEALAVGGATALLLAARSRAPRALVAVWGAGSPARAPARAGARRLATALDARGHEAIATGRLALVRLTGPLQTAAAEAVRASAVACEVPTVVVLAGARDEAADDLLRDQDAVLVARPAGGDPTVAELTLAGLAGLGVHGRTIDLPPATPPVRALAACGVAVLAPLRGALEAALEGAG